MKDHVLALDQGTTGSTAIVFDGRGKAVSRGYAELPQHYPRPGWVEHDPKDLLEKTLEAARQALEASPVRLDRIAGIGLTNQRETFVVWERETGAAVHRAIVWQCRRSAAWCEEARAQGLEADVQARTGLLLDSYFSGSKLKWLLDAEPGLRARAERGELCFGTVDTWLIWHLTGGRRHVTDVTNASRTLLWNLEGGSWDPALCRVLGVPEGMLPEALACDARFGETVAIGPLPAGLPIAGVAGDQHAALFGQACFEAGEAKNTYGTGCFMLANTGETVVRSRNRLLSTMAFRREGQAPRYALEGSVFVGGAAVQWLRDGLGLIRTAAESEEVARSVPDTGGVVLVPAFVGLGAPYWDGFARGTLTGLTRGTTRAHIVRATLEAIAYQSADLASAMAADRGAPLAALQVDGGASANGFLMQFQADLLGLPVVRRAEVEATAWGAAALAGLSLGVYESEAQLRALAAEKDVTRFEPRWDAEARARHQRAWQEAVGRTLSKPPAPAAAEAPSR